MYHTHMHIHTHTHTYTHTHIHIQVLTNPGSPVRNSDGSIKVNGNSDIIAITSKAPQASPTARMHWSITGPGLPNMDSDSDSDAKYSETSAFLSGRSGSSVIIDLYRAPTLLLTGARYTVILTVNVDDAIGSASVQLSVNIPPSPGVCIGAPREGSHLQVMLHCVCMCLCIYVCMYVCHWCIAHRKSS
jgi:hypothetical protein